ncbi:MFS transporter [Seinonella peptonophila]|uniref:MFS transporter n=1 Tax=Seinonella peptonophila TaxID=112248 RepID=UPI001FEBC04A|nr:MFS transporter [Seinonella peptonophila]
MVVLLSQTLYSSVLLFCNVSLFVKQEKLVEYVGIILAIRTISSGIFVLIGGNLSSRFGAKRVLLVSMLGAIPSFLAVGFSQTIVQFVVVQVLSGSMNGLVVASFAILVSQAVSQKGNNQRRAFGASITTQVFFIPCAAVGGWIQSPENRSMWLIVISICLSCSWFCGCFIRKSQTQVTLPFWKLIDLKIVKVVYPIGISYGMLLIIYAYLPIETDWRYGWIQGITIFTSALMGIILPRWVEAKQDRNDYSLIRMGYGALISCPTLLIMVPVIPGVIYGLQVGYLLAGVALGIAVTASVTGFRTLSQLQVTEEQKKVSITTTTVTADAGVIVPMAYNLLLGGWIGGNNPNFQVVWGSMIVLCFIPFLLVLRKRL